jgi:hypothetical protein
MALSVEKNETVSRLGDYGASIAALSVLIARCSFSGSAVARGCNSSQSVSCCHRSPSRWRWPWSNFAGLSLWAARRRTEIERSLELTDRGDGDVASNIGFGRMSFP